MTLDRLLLAWLPVAVWFTGVGAATGRLTRPEGTFWPVSVYLYRAAGRAGVEGLVLTLLASLWFDTLGSGVWWLPVTLVGMLVALARTAPALPSIPHTRRTVVFLFFADLLRYVAAGALLAWRLGS